MTVEWQIVSYESKTHDRLSQTKKMNVKIGVLSDWILHWDSFPNMKKMGQGCSFPVARAKIWERESGVNETNVWVRDLAISPPFSSTSSGSFYLHDFSQGCIETGDGTARFPSQRLRSMFELFYIKFTHLCANLTILFVWFYIYNLKYKRNKNTYFVKYIFTGI